MSRVLFIFLLIFIPGIALSQQNVRDSSISFFVIGASAAYQFPGGDLSDRFGNNMNVGGFFQWKTKSNLIFGIEGQFIFGNTVKEDDILNSLATDQGGIIASDGSFADVILYERGYKFDFKVGKIFPVIGPNKNSGLLATVSSGILQHKIRIENQSSAVPSIEDDYKKGYDRLSNGLSVSAFLGYVNYSNHRMVNFYAGFELTKGFTQNRRSFNYDTREHDARKRNDLLLGIRVGWMIPIYKRTPKQFYYN
ncbi:MAG: hypothetical protein KA444_02275 [Bacteroidia bacterium]|nr:hypothetical protein [Bacteroidia bacterium]